MYMSEHELYMTRCLQLALHLLADFWFMVHLKSPWVFVYPKKMNFVVRTYPSIKFQPIQKMLCFKPYFDFQRDSKESLFFAYINTQTIIITLSQPSK